MRLRKRTGYAIHLTPQVRVDVRAWMRERSMTRRSTALAMGIKTTTLNGKLNGRLPISSAQFNLLMRALNVNQKQRREMARELLTGTGWIL